LIQGGYSDRGVALRDAPVSARNRNILAVFSRIRVADKGFIDFEPQQCCGFPILAAEIKALPNFLTPHRE
jgi:hypothetical protein